MEAGTITDGEKDHPIAFSSSRKSSIVCAICLGLAGHPRVIGRAGNIGDYIKTGSDKAVIEIEL